MKILKWLLWLIHHKTDKYTESVLESTIFLNYTVYKVYRIHKILMIPYRVYQCSFSSLGSGEEKRAEYWDKINRLELIKQFEGIQAT